MIEICPKQDCSACSACLNACARGAICMLPDESGCLYPEIESKLCVDCGACRNVCPNLQPPVFNYPIEALVGCASDLQEQLSSTSGGIASVFSRMIIEGGGAVYGSTSLDPFDVHHVRIDKDSDAKLLKGSKYVQSRIGETYSLVRKDLLSDLQVLFVGTPCQVAGLKTYLRKDYPNLYTVDFVCHGVPPQQLFNDFLNKSLDGKCKDGITVDFRFKDKKGRTKYGLQVKSADGQLVLREVFPNNDYILGFLKGLFYRENCYSCKYARPERVSDITLGDYRDDNNQHKYIKNKDFGLSKILINTTRGKDMLEKAKNSLQLSEIAIEELINAGGQLVKPMPRHKQFKDFKINYVTLGIGTFTDEILKPIKKETKRSILISRIVNIIYKLPYTKTAFKFIKNNK